MLGNIRNNLAKCMKILKQLHLRSAVEPEISVKLSLNLRFCSLMAISSQLGGGAQITGLYIWCTTSGSNGSG